MVLNEDLAFADAGEVVKRAFRGVPEKMLLNSNVRLHKWTSAARIDGSRITPWWSFVETIRLPSGRCLEGFRTAERRAARLGTTHREFVRARAGISDQFGNTMTDLVMGVMLMPVWGFAGYASGQPEFAKDRPDLGVVFLIGGAPHVWVPNLTPRHITTIPVLG